VKKILLAIALFSLSFLQPQKASAQQFDQYFIFGDSLVDNGNLFRLTGNQVPPAPYFQGRFSDGPVWSEILGSQFQIVPASTNNFAIGGSSSGNVNTLSGALGTQLPSLPFQVNSQFNQFLTQGTVSPNALFVVSAGANDYLFLPTQLRATNTQTVVNNISNTVTTLIDKGARNIIVSNLPTLGNTPQEQALGTASVSTNLAQSHNQNLNIALGAIARSRSDVNIIPLDLNALFTEVIAKPDRFGLTNVTQPCFDRTAGTLCSNRNQYLFWDGLHPTTVGHQIIAQYAASVINAPKAFIPQGDIALNISKRQVQLIDARLLALRSNVNQDSQSTSGPLGVFLNGDVNFGDRDTTSKYPGYDFTTSGVTAGFDYQVSPGLAVGIALGAVGNDTDLKGNRGSISSDGYNISVYSNYVRDSLYVNGAIGYGGNSFDIKRKTNFNNRTAVGNTDGNQLSVNVNGGYVAKSQNISFGPTAGLRYNRINIDGYTEKGADSLNMRVNDQQADSLILSLGAQAAMTIDAGKDSKIIRNIRANYEHEFANDTRTITSELISQPGIPMRSQSSEPDRDAEAAAFGDRIRLGAGVQMVFSKNLAGAIDYETVIGQDKFSENAVKGEIRYQF
jgi:outer membrane lipase/esterase